MLLYTGCGSHCFNAWTAPNSSCSGADTRSTLNDCCVPSGARLRHYYGDAYHDIEHCSELVVLNTPLPGPYAGWAPQREPGALLPEDLAPLSAATEQCRQ